MTAPGATRTVAKATGLAGLLAVLGPGLLAGLSDDDPAGITTYSVLGADHGYRLLWLIVVSTAALILFHDLGARLGVVTGQGLIGLIRDRYGVRLAAAALGLLVLANLGTTCAEFAGIAAGFELLGIPRAVSVPTAAVGVSLLVLRGNFHRIEHVLMALSAVFLTYIGATFLSGPDWGAAAAGLVTPSMPLTRDAVVLATATVGTTLAPWGLSFIQSYAADKKLTPVALRFETVDVVVGATLTGVIGCFVAIANAATLHLHGIHIEDAADASRALEPLAGNLASTLFAVGLIGAAILAASILPLSTAYSVCEFVGFEAALDDTFAEAKVFYVTYGLVAGIGAAVVLIPSVPLVPVLVLTQAVNAVLLLPLLFFMRGLAGDRSLLGPHVAGHRLQWAYGITIGLVGVCVAGLLVLSVIG